MDIVRQIFNLLDGAEPLTPFTAFEKGVQLGAKISAYNNKGNMAEANAAGTSGDNTAGAFAIVRAGAAEAVTDEEKAELFFSINSAFKNSDLYNHLSPEQTEADKYFGELLKELNARTNGEYKKFIDIISDVHSCAMAENEDNTILNILKIANVLRDIINKPAEYFKLLKAPKTAPVRELYPVTD